MFDNTITFSEIPYKCSHFAEIEIIKIFDFNYFVNRIVNYYSHFLNFDMYLIHRGRLVFIIAIKEFPSLGLQNKPLISMLGPVRVFGYFTILLG
jgi:hypothetical protein